jgi:hypothetical protein
MRYCERHFVVGNSFESFNLIIFLSREQCPKLLVTYVISTNKLSEHCVSRNAFEKKNENENALHYQILSEAKVLALIANG